MSVLVRLCAYVLVFVCCLHQLWAVLLQLARNKAKFVVNLNKIQQQQERYTHCVAVVAIAQTTSTIAMQSTDTIQCLWLTVATAHHQLATLPLKPHLFFTSSPHSCHHAASCASYASYAANTLQLISANLSQPYCQQVEELPVVAATMRRR